MSVLVDTGVFFAHHDRDAERHEAAVGAFDELLDGEYGQPYTNDYVLDETVALTRTRTCRSRRRTRSPGESSARDRFHRSSRRCTSNRTTFGRRSGSSVGTTITICVSPTRRSSRSVSRGVSTPY
jgi:predicted nucleic acid-binding protein